MTVDEQGLRFDCAGESLVGVLSRPAGKPPVAVGLVIAVGGPQYRAGSHRQFVLLARRLAAAGHAVLRFDCRGMGDSSGDFPGFEQLGPDLAAARAALQAAVPEVTRVVLWGLCDAASAALLGAGHTPWAGLVLLNPWVRHVDTHARTEIRHYYAQRLFDRAFWRKLLAGQVRVGESAREVGGKLWLSLQSSWRSSWRARMNGGASDALHADDPLSTPADFRDGMARGALAFGGPQLYLLSGRDHVCAEFVDHAGSSPVWSRVWARSDVERLPLPAADHTFSSRELRGAVEAATLAFVARLSSAAPRA